MMDIECEDERGFPEPNRDAIVCITCHDSFDDAYVTLYRHPPPGRAESAVPVPSVRTMKSSPIPRNVTS